MVCCPHQTLKPCRGIAAIDADTKLVPSWLVGSRDIGCATALMQDLAGRLSNRVQITTHGLKAYVSAVEEAFGGDVDFAQLQKIYGPAPTGPETRYSPPACIGCEKRACSPDPDGATGPGGRIRTSSIRLPGGEGRPTTPRRSAGQ